MNSAKLITWENKGSLSFVEQLVHHVLSVHLNVLQRPAVVGWGKTGLSSFPGVLILLEPTRVSAMKVTLSNLSGTRISESQPPLVVPCSPCWPRTGSYGWHSSEWQPFWLLEPCGCPELLQWDLFVYLVFWNFYLPKILYSGWFFFFSWFSTCIETCFVDVLSRAIDF